MEIKVKRAYEPQAPDDGYRVYIDRLWPRGLSKAKFHYDAWDKEIAPTKELREWFHADPDGRWPEFHERYTAYLVDLPAFADMKNQLSGKEVVTLLYSSRDHEHNNAVVVVDALKANS